MLFGKHADCTVDQLLNLQKTLYLRWVYYNCSMISFQDEILRALGIKDEWVINKPGTDPELYEELNTFKRGNVKGLDGVKWRARMKKKKRLAQFTFDKPHRRVESRSKLQARNQNKYKRP